tara:strand:- start:440 stop:730 length:291 start_codon:yes stop_codon:yes gene_type:complete
MSSRPSPAKVRSVLARIRKVEHWRNLSEHQTEDASMGVGAIADNETDSNYREGLLHALAWVAGEYGDDMPPGIEELVQHTNKREFMKLLKEQADLQ